MKKALLLTLILTFTFVIYGSGAWAQESAEEEFTLEEITVTAEKRSVSLQEIPASVVAIEGIELAQQGKLTTAQILEGVPNVKYRGGSGTNPDGNITIRGIQRTQESGGTNAVLPSTTATYTDGVYQGIGGGYDINRVEVLRGPQGTLYGRSATGGVVAFYTNDPKLAKFEGNLSAEYGTASLKNVNAALNVPAGDKIAFRAAAHFMSREGYFNEDGGKTETKEGRIRALFQPTDALGIVLSVSMAETKSWGGGWSAALTSPDEIDYKYSYTEPSEGAPNKYRQAALNLNYDLGTSTLTWIGGYHDYDSTGLGASTVGGDGVSWHADQTKWPTDYYHSEEVRWASGDDFPIDWITMLVGANYFKHEYDTSLFSVQTTWPDDAESDPERDYLAPIFGQEADGVFNNYGLFTEETFKVQDNFRITAGLRYDKTNLVQNMYWRMNTNLSSTMANMNPPTWMTPPPLTDDEHDYNNVTYKLRFEYDVTPDNMLYLMTATGFMPGYAALSPMIGMGPSGISVTWVLMQMDQQKLTSYEFGSKNTFLDNTLRLNGDVFYYDYEGYPEAVELYRMGPSPVFGICAVPLEIYGVEINAEYLITMYDRLTLDAGWQSIKIAEFPTIEKEGVTYDGKNFMYFDKLPGNPDMTATLAYDHTFALKDGSTLVPRAELRYTGGYYLTQMTRAEATAVDANGVSRKEYNYQSSYMLLNLGATWTSADQKYSGTAYVRNVLDEEYKTGINADATTVTPGDPRAFGVMFNINF
ncbi:MAG: TonB-dependent receptor [Deltaproteobacteria bacterium]|nr:TonB-dependent receptor [Deltaproteobacteria bacterium]